MSASEGAMALLALRGCAAQDDAERLRQATAVLRAAVEAEVAPRPAALRGLRPPALAADRQRARPGPTTPASSAPPPTPARWPTPCCRRPACSKRWKACRCLAVSWPLDAAPCRRRSHPPGCCVWPPRHRARRPCPAGRRSTRAAWRRCRPCASRWARWWARRNCACATFKTACAVATPKPQPCPAGPSWTACSKRPARR